MMNLKTVIALALSALAQQAPADTPNRADVPSSSILDPLFGISMTWGSVPFESVTDAVYLCEQLKGQPHGYLFLFASASQDGVTYDLIYGWERVVDDDSTTTSAHFEQDVTATIVVTKDHRCVGTVSDGYAWSTNERDRSVAISKYGLTDTVATALLDDGFKRAVRAFGGAKPFVKKLDENSSTTNSSQLDYLAKKVSSLREYAAQRSH